MAFVDWASDLDVPVAASWLVLSVFTVPFIVRALFNRFVPRQTVPKQLAAGLVVLLLMYWLGSAAALLGNIDCQRRTHHPCVHDDEAMDP